MKQLKAEMQWVLGCRLFEKIKRTAVVRELGLLVDEKETRRSNFWKHYLSGFHLLLKNTHRLTLKNEFMMLGR
jgi:hypothetical protein